MNGSSKNAVFLDRDHHLAAVHWTNLGETLPYSSKDLNEIGFQEIKKNTLDNWKEIMDALGLSSLFPEEARTVLIQLIQKSYNPVIWKMIDDGP